MNVPLRWDGLDKLGKLGKMDNETIFLKNQVPKTKTKWRPKPNSPRKKNDKKEKKNERTFRCDGDRLEKLGKLGKMNKKPKFTNSGSINQNKRWRPKAHQLKLSKNGRT